MGLHLYFTKMSEERVLPDQLIILGNRAYLYHLVSQVGAITGVSGDSSTTPPLANL